MSQSQSVIQSVHSFLTKWTKRRRTLTKPPFSLPLLFVVVVVVRGPLMKWFQSSVLSSRPREFNFGFESVPESWKLTPACVPPSFLSVSVIAAGKHPGKVCNNRSGRWGVSLRARQEEEYAAATARRFMAFNMGTLNQCSDLPPPPVFTGRLVFHR